jgi:NurA-like 5'-3' nuclease
MRMRWTVLGIALATTGVSACGGGEDAAIESYFAALSSGDERAIHEAGVVRISEKVDGWSRVGSSEGTTLPVTLPELAARHDEAVAKLEAHRKVSGKYALDHLSDVDAVKKLLEEGKEIPEKLEEIAEEWKRLSDEEAELQDAAREALAAMEREKRVCQLSAGEASDLTTAGGEIHVKQIDLNLTIDGQSRPFVMTLRRYMLEETDVPHEISRWVVYDLQPKA